MFKPYLHLQLQNIAWFEVYLLYFKRIVNHTTYFSEFCNRIFVFFNFHNFYCVMFVIIDALCWYLSRNNLIIVEIMVISL